MEKENVLVMSETNSNNDFNNDNDNIKNSDEINNKYNNNNSNDDDTSIMDNDDNKIKDKKKSVNKDFAIEVIPSKLEYRDDNDVYSSYESNEMIDYSNASLATTQGSSGSTLCVHNNKVNPLDDPIIQEMFKQRTVEMDKVEEERRIRMYTMMRYSKKYKHLLIERANIKWDKHTVEDNNDVEKSLTDVTNDEENEYECQDNCDEEFKSNLYGSSQLDDQKNLKQKRLSSNFGIDLHDLDLIDMELNNDHNNNSENNNEEIMRSSTHNENEEIITNPDIQVYNNNKNNNNNINYNSILKSNSKNSSSSSSSSEHSPGELDENNNSNDNNEKLNSFSKNYKLQVNNFFDSKDISYNNNDIQIYQQNNYAINNLQDKNMKKHKKLKLFRLSYNHKTKNKMEIEDTNSFKTVNFISSNSLNSSTGGSNNKLYNYSQSNIYSSTSLSSSTNDDNSSNFIPKSDEKKAKHYGFIKFFVNKKHSKVINLIP